MNNAATQVVASFSTPSLLLRRALLTDATLTAITGFALALAGSQLATLLGLPVGLLRGAAVILIPFAAFVAWLGMRERVHRTLLFVAIALNALWALDSVLLLFSGWVEPTVLGEIFTLGQALVVAALAEAQFIGLRRSTVVESYARR